MCECVRTHACMHVAPMSGTHATAEEEISMFRRFSDAYSYAFFITSPES